MVEREQARGRRADYAIARIEQLYPRPVDEHQGRDRAATRTSRRSAGCRTSRANMGPWPHYALNLCAGARRHAVDRVIPAGVVVLAVGGQHVKRHVEEQKDAASSSAVRR